MAAFANLIERKDWYRASVLLADARAAM